MFFTDRTVQIDDARKFHWMRIAEEEILIFLLGIDTNPDGSLISNDIPLAHNVDWDILTEVDNYLLIPETPRETSDGKFFSPTVILLDMKNLVQGCIHVSFPPWLAIPTKTYFSWKDDIL